LPDLLLEGRPGESDGDGVERRDLAGEIALERGHVSERIVPRHERGVGRRRSTLKTTPLRTPRGRRVLPAEQTQCAAVVRYQDGDPERRVHPLDEEWCRFSHRCA